MLAKLRFFILNQMQNFTQMIFVALYFTSLKETTKFPKMLQRCRTDFFFLNFESRLIERKVQFMQLN